MLRRNCVKFEVMRMRDLDLNVGRLLGFFHMGTPGSKWKAFARVYAHIQISNKMPFVFRGIREMSL